MTKWQQYKAEAYEHLLHYWAELGDPEKIEHLLLWHLDRALEFWLQVGEE